MDDDVSDEVVELYLADAPHSGNRRGRQPGGPDVTAPAVDLRDCRDVAEEIPLLKKVQVKPTQMNAQIARRVS